MSRFVVCFTVLVSFAVPASAAPRTLSLHQAKELALAHNPTLGRADLAFIEATAARDALDASYDTQLSVDGTGRAERAQPRRTTFTQLLSRDEAAVSAALARVFPAGGEARVGFAMSFERATTRLPSQLGHDDIAQTTHAPRVEGSFRQPLWGGRRIGAANAAQVRATRWAAGLDQNALLSTTLRDVTRAYWQLYLAEREVAIRGEARAAAEAQLRQVEAEIARGTRARLSAIEIEDALARLREDELVAIGAVGERALDLSRAIGITPTTELHAGDAPGDLCCPTDGSLEHAPRMVAAEARIAVARAELDRVTDETRWRIDGVIAGSLAAPRDTLRAALDDTAAYGGWRLEIGLVIRGPLSDRGAIAKRGGARARWQAARLAHREIEGELAAEIGRLRNRRGVARQRRLALVRSVDLAEQNLRAERNRWERGDTTAFELLRRQATLAETALRLERARVDELEADTALAAVFGILRS